MGVFCNLVLPLLLSFHLQGKKRTPSVSANHSDFQVFPKRNYFPALHSETLDTLLALPHALFSTTRHAVLQMEMVALLPWVVFSKRTTSSLTVSCCV